MKVEVLYIADCPNYKPTVNRVLGVLRTVGIDEGITEVEVQNAAEAEQWRFFGSPTVRVNGLDVEPEARAVQHFGLGCRSYADGRRRSGMPSEELILQALQEDQGGTQPSAPKATSQTEATARQTKRNE